MVGNLVFDTQKFYVLWLDYGMGTVLLFSLDQITIYLEEGSHHPTQDVLLISVKNVIG